MAFADTHPASALYPSLQSHETTGLLTRFHRIQTLAKYHVDSATFAIAANQVPHDMPGRQYAESVSISHERARPAQAFMHLLRIPSFFAYPFADDHSLGA